MAAAKDYANGGATRAVKRGRCALQVAMAERLIESDDHDTAQQIIIDGLKKQYDDRLVMPIPRLKTNNPEQLEKVLRQQIKAVGDVRCCGAPWASR